MKKLRLNFFVSTLILLTLVIACITCFTFVNQVNAATSTGLQDPSSSSGNWSNPDRAYDDDGAGYATSDSSGEQEKYGGYGFTLPSSASIISVTIRLDVHRGYAPTADNLKLEVSVDGGTTFLATTQTINIERDWHTYTIEITSWTSWTADKINNDKIWARVTHVKDGLLVEDMNLDWIPIEVTYEVLTTTTTSISESTITLGASVTAAASVKPTINAMQPTATFIGSGYADTNTGMGDSNALFPPYPSHLEVNDLILLQLTIRDSSTSPPSIGNGFTLLYGPDSTGTTARQWIYYKFSTGSESGGLFISLGNLAVTSMARMYAFRYVELSSSFYEGGGSGSGSGTGVSAQSVTTSGVNRLAVSFVFVADDNALGSFSGESGGYDWGEVGSEYTTALGGQGTIQLQAAMMVTAGTISGGSYSMVSSASWGVRSFALKPIVPTGTVTFYAKPDGGSWNAFGSKTLVGGSATSDAYAPTIAGTWYFKAVYGGYGYFAGSSSGETDEPIKVSSVVVHADSDWPMFHGDQIHSGYSISTTPSATPTLWSHHTSGYVTSSPAVVDGVVYVGSNDCEVYALNAATGAEIWSYFTQHAPRIGGVTSSPAVVDGVVYVGSDYNYFYALNAATGKQIWNHTIVNVADCSPVVVSGVVYLGATDGTLCALSASTGAEIWSYATGGSVSSPAVVDGVVYVGSGDFNVYALNALTGALKWSYPTGNYVYGSPAVVDGVVYIGSIDNKVYALDAETGALKWSYATGAPIYSCPAVVDGVLYIGSTDYKVYALDAITGAEKWIYTTGGRIESSPAIVNGVLYVGSDDYSVYGLNASTGAKLWNYPTGGPVRSSPAVVDGVLYIGSYDFNVYALNTGTSIIKHLTVTSEYGSPISTSTGDISQGTVVTVSVASIVNGPAGVRHLCTGWTGTGSVPASGTANKVTFILMDDSSITWNWKTQYYLTVSSAYGSPGGEAWYESGATTYATLTATAFSGVPYVFTGWGGDTSGSNYVSTYFSSDAITMDGPKMAIANWVMCNPTKWIQYLGTYVSSTPALANDIIYAGSHYFLYAVDASTGTQKWYYNTGMTSSSQGGVRSSPTIVDGVLYCGSDGPSKNVYALNAMTSAEIWTYDTEGSVGFSSPAVANGFVYIGSANCKLFALDAETGVLKWTYQAGAAITCSPTVANGLVYFGSEDHKVYALDATTGAVEWSYTTGHQIDFSTPAVVDGVVYIGSGDCKVYALDASTGAFQWSYTTGGFVQSSPTVADGVVYVGSGDGSVYALDAATGAKIWSQVTGYVRTSPAVADGVVYVSSINRNIYALDASTGTVMWSYATGDGVYSSPLVVDGIVYVGSGDGKLYAIKAGNWRPHLTVTSAYGSPTPAAGDFCRGTVVTASVDSMVDGPAGVRYVCTGWTGTGCVPASGTCTSVTFTIKDDSSITWNWKTQYQVMFTVSPSGGGSTSPSTPPSDTGVWEDAGPLSISASANSGYAFSSWSSSTQSIAFNNANSASTTATLNGPGTVTANFEVSDTTPPTGSVAINSGGSYTKVVSVTLSLSASDPDDSVAQMRFSNDGSSWSFWESYATSKSWILTTSDGAKTVYVQFKDSAGNPSVSYSDSIILDTVVPSGSITSPTDGAIENSGSFTVSGSASDDTSGVQKVEVSVDSGSYGAVTSGTTSWSYSASDLAYGSHTFKIKVTDNAGWTYESSQISVTVAHVLTVTTNPESIDSTTGGGTYASGDGVSITVPEYYSIDSTSRYRFTSWTSSGGGSFDDASSPSTTFTMPAGDVTVMANYVTQYYLTVSDSGHGTPGGSGYYDYGATAYATITPLTVSGGSGVRYVFAGWTGDDSGSGSPSDGITMDGAKTATATWTDEYELTMAQSPVSAGASLNPAAGGGHWYAAGASVSISTDENVGTSGSRYHFNGWTSGAGSFDSASSASADFTMPASAVTVTANYIGQYQVTFQYTVLGDASPNDPTVYYTKSGVPTSTLASTGTSVSDWVDTGTPVSYDNPLFEGPAQRWQTDLEIVSDKSVVDDSVDAIETLNPTYYHQLKVTFQYTVVGGGSPTAPTVYYNQFGSETTTAASTDSSVYGWVDKNSEVAYTKLLTSSGSTERWRGDMSGSDAKGIAKVSVTISETLNPTYYHQYLVTFQYTVDGGGSPSAPRVYYTYYGFSGQNALASTGTGAYDWVDAGTSVWYINPLSDSASTERWQADYSISTDRSEIDASIDAAETLNPTYYHQYSINFGYSDQDISAITAAAKIGSYTQFGSPNDINAGATYGSTSPASAWVDAGTGKVSYQTFTSTGGDERWALSSSPENKDVTTAGTISESGYFHQYMIRFGYITLIDKPTTISGGVAGQTIGSYIHFGSSNPITPSSTRGQTNPASAFVDAGTSKVSYITYTTASNTERWALSTSPHNMNVYTSGLFSEVGYYHQYQLSIEVSGLDAEATTTDTVVELITRQFGSSTYPSFAVSDFSSAIHIFVNAHDIDTGFAFADVITSTDSGKQYAWATTTGTGSAADETRRAGVFDLGAASTLRATYKVQWDVAFSQTGIDSDAGSSTILTVGTTDYAYDALPSGWFDDGTTFSWLDPVAGDSASEQFVKTDQTGVSPIDGSTTTYSATYQKQWKVSFHVSGLDGDAGTNTVLTVGSDTYDCDDFPVDDIWVNHNTVFTWASTVDGGEGKQFALDDTSGLGSPVTVSGTSSATYIISVLTYTGDTSGQYSDPVTVSATLLSDGSGVSGVTITFTIGTQSETAVTGADGSASATITLDQTSGDYTVAASCSGAYSTALSVSEDFTINKETATVEYTGDAGSVKLAGETDTGRTVRVAAQVTQDPDGYDGDLSLVTLEFTIDTPTPGGFTATLHNVPVNSAGQAIAFIDNVPVDAYTITVTIEDNSYWTCAEDDENTLAVCPFNGEGYITGGGWIPCEDSINGKINFAFVVQYDKRGNPKGSFVAVFKSKDGFTYRIKSTSWARNKASLTFGTNDDDLPTACLTFGGVVQIIDRVGDDDGAWGNCIFVVDMTDGDYGGSQNGDLDSIAITVVDNAGIVALQWGDNIHQIHIGGGNIVVAVAGHGKKN